MSIIKLLAKKAIKILLYLWWQMIMMIIITKFARVVDTRLIARVKIEMAGRNRVGIISKNFPLLKTRSIHTRILIVIMNNNNSLL